MAIDRDEQQCVDIVLANHPGDAWVYTNERYSYLDGLFVRGGVIKAVAEIKTRECEFGTYKKELMTWNKMESGQWAAKSLLLMAQNFYAVKGAFQATYIL